MTKSACATDEYLPASFNGVPFYCTEATSEHGRRGAEGEFPFGESTAYADLGRRIRTYTLNGIIREDNHVFLTAALIAACELPGPGILVHPTRGILNAACKSIHVTDHIQDEAGITYIDMEFVEGNAWPNGLSLVGTILGLVVGTIIGASSTSFKERYQPRNVSPVRRPAVIDIAQSSIGMVADSYSQAIQNQKDDRKFRALSDLRDVERDDVLASDPIIADKALVLGMNALSNEITETAKFNTFKSFANKTSGSITLPGLAGESEDAVYSHTRLLSATYMAQAAVETPYAKVHEALAALDAVVAILDEEATNARNRCDNALYLTIEQFKTDTQTILYEKAYRLPRLVEFDFHGGVHALVASYALYGDAKRHRELELRNIVDANGRIGPSVVAAVS